MNSYYWHLFFTCLITYLINLPFGYWRGGLKKLSFWWFIAIHAPVPLVVITRKLFDIQLSWTLIPFLFGSFFLGQFSGNMLRKRKIANE